MDTHFEPSVLYRRMTAGSAASVDKRIELVEAEVGALKDTFSGET
jgi:hypothetical protein